MGHYKDDEDRRYYDTPIGQLRSVTSYLSELAKPALVPWAAGITATYFKDHLEMIKSGDIKLEDMVPETIVKEAKAHYKTMQEQAMELGSAVHEAVEKYYAFEGIPTKDPEVSRLAQEAIGCINDKLHFVVDKSEQMVYHPVGYAGTLDIVGTAAPGMVKRWAKAILDLKTGKAIYPEAKMQVAAYAEAWEYLHKEKVYFAIILRIDKETGKASETYVMKRPEWKKQYKAFKQLVKFCQARDKLKENKHDKGDDERTGGV